MVLNTVKDNRERVGRMLLMHANHREDVERGSRRRYRRAGRAQEHHDRRHAVRSAASGRAGADGVPEPVIEIAVEPKTKGDQEKMGQALARLATEDPSFRVTVDHESGQTVIKGMGELHLEIIVDRMKREFKVDANVGAPQVAYRETITRAAEIDYIHRKQTGGAGQFARVKIRFEPRAAGQRLCLREQGDRRHGAQGIRAGRRKGAEERGRERRHRRLPGDRHQGRLFDGAYHDVDSSVLAFEIAARAAFKEGVMKAGADAAGADHAGRGGDPGRLYGRRYWRP